MPREWKFAVLIKQWRRKKGGRQAGRQAGITPAKRQTGTRTVAFEPGLPENSSIVWYAETAIERSEIFSRPNGVEIDDAVAARSPQASGPRTQA